MYYRVKPSERAWACDHSSDGQPMTGRLVAMDGFAGVAMAISDSPARFPLNVGVSMQERMALWRSSEERKLETRPGVRFVSVTSLEGDRWAVQRAFRDGRGFSFQAPVELAAGDAEEFAAFLRKPWYAD